MGGALFGALALQKKAGKKVPAVQPISLNIDYKDNEYKEEVEDNVDDKDKNEYKKNLKIIKDKDNNKFLYIEYKIRNVIYFYPVIHYIHKYSFG